MGSMSIAPTTSAQPRTVKVCANMLREETIATNTKSVENRVAPRLDSRLRGSASAINPLAEIWIVFSMSPDPANTVTITSAQTKVADQGVRTRTRYVSGIGDAQHQSVILYVTSHGKRAMSTNATCSVASALCAVLILDSVKTVSQQMKPSLQARKRELTFDIDVCAKDGCFDPQDRAFDHSASHNFCSNHRPRPHPQRPDHSQNSALASGSTTTIPQSVSREEEDDYDKISDVSRE